MRSPTSGCRSRSPAASSASRRAYGARRVWHDVLAEGLSCGLHRVERLMRLHGQRARPRRRGLPKDEGVRSVIADNILARDFQADRPNQKWLADFTYVWTAEGWLYVAVVMDPRWGRRPPDGVLILLDLPAHRRLVHEGRARRFPGHGCPDDGGLASRQSRRLASPLRPGQPGRSQPTVATGSRSAAASASSSASAGVLHPRVRRGRPLRAAATASSSSGPCWLRSVPFGKYWRKRPLVF